MERKTTIYSLIIIGTVALLAYTVGGFGDVMHGIADIFVRGDSSSRVFVFLGWMAVLFVVASIRSAKRGHKTSARWVVGSMIAVFALGAFMQVWFAYSYNVDPLDLTLAVNGREMTITALGHNHLGKSVIGSVLAPFAPYFERLDPGIGIAPFVPAPLRVLFGASFLAFVFSLLIYFKDRLKAIRHGKAAFVVAFGLVSGQALIQAIDGGIFSTNAILGVGLLCAMVFAAGAERGRRFWLLSLGALGLQFAWYAIFPDVLASTVADIFPFYISAIALWAVISLLASAAFDIGTRKRALCLSSLVIALVILVPIYVRESSATSIIAKTAYIATYKKHDDPSYKLLGSINQLLVYIYNGPSKKLGDLIADQDTLEQFNPVSVPGKTCPIAARSRVETFRVLSKGPMIDIKKPDIGVGMAVEPIPNPIVGMFAYDIAIVSPSCMPRHLSVLQEMLISAGGGESIVSKAL